MWRREWPIRDVAAVMGCLRGLRRGWCAGDGLAGGVRAGADSARRGCAERPRTWAFALSWRTCGNPTMRVGDAQPHGATVSRCKTAPSGGGGCKVNVWSVMRRFDGTDLTGLGILPEQASSTAPPSQEGPLMAAPVVRPWRSA
jgi:hypothetical protein